MKKFLAVALVLLMSACTTEYILMDEDGNPVNEDYYTDGYGNTATEDEQFAFTDPADMYIGAAMGERRLSANDVFVVNEETDSVTYQYKNVRVDEISPLASLYCADASFGASPYLREVSMYHNGFMRATFDCVNLAI